MGGSDFVIEDNFDWTAYPVELVPDITRGLLGIWLPGMDAARTARNYYPYGVGDGTIGGAPVYGNGYAQFTANSSWLQLPIDEPDDLTVIGAFQTTSNLSNTANRPMLWGNQTTTAGIGVNAGGSSGLPAGAFNLSTNHTTGTNPTTTALTVPAIQDWHMMAWSIKEDQRIAYNHTTGQVVTQAETRVRNKAPGQMRVGSTYFPNFAGVTRCGYYRFHDAALSLAEMQRECAPVRRFLTANNITA